MIATVIRLGGTVEDLSELELSYAPPFSSAKDPVNMAGFVAQNVLTGKSKVMTWEEVAKLEQEDYILVDVRTEEEFENGHVEGALNLPVDSLRERLSELDPGKKIVEYCQVGLRGHVAESILNQYGYEVINVTGGYKSYTALQFDPKQGSKNSSSSNQNNRNIGEGKHVVIDADTQVVKEESKSADSFDMTLDACGLCCPGPLMQVKASMNELEEGQILKVTASDPGFYEDIKAWCKRTNHELVNLQKSGGNIIAFIKKKYPETVSK